MMKGVKSSSRTGNCSINSRDGRCPRRIRSGIRYARIRLWSIPFSVDERILAFPLTLDSSEIPNDSGKMLGLAPVRTRRDSESKYLGGSQGKYKPLRNFRSKNGSCLDSTGK